MADRELRYRVVGDSRSGQRAATELESSLKNLGPGLDSVADRTRRYQENLDRLGPAGQKVNTVLDSVGARLNSMGTGAALAVGGVTAVGLGLTALAAQGIPAASALGEQVAATSQTFEDAADQVLRFGETTASAYGISNRAALAAANAFGNLFTNVGFGNEQAAQFSETLVSLAGDIASFRDLQTEDVLEKMRSGLVGETEPLRTLGVFINEAAVKAKAMELGLGGANRELTEGEKVAARLAIMLDQTAKAQGDVARTSDSLANRQRRLNAEWEDASAKLGGFLIPIVSNATDKVSELVGELQRAADAIPGADGEDGSFLGDLAKDLSDAFSATPQIAGPLESLAGLLGTSSDEGDKASETFARVAQTERELGLAAGTLTSQLKGQAGAHGAAARSAEDQAKAVKTLAGANSALIRSQLEIETGQDSVSDADRAVADARTELAEATAALGKTSAGVANAQRSLADAHTEAGKSAEDSAEQIAAAEQRLAEAVEEGAEQIADAQRQAAEANEDAAERIVDAQEALAEANEEGVERVVDAQASLAEAVEEAAERIVEARADQVEAEERAAERIESASRSVISARRAEVDAEEALADAREAAARRLDDLQEQVEDGARAERAAIRRVEEAEEQLAQAQRDRRADEGDRTDAQIAYEDAVDALDDLQKRNAELAREQAEAAQAGVDGAEDVLDAQDRLREAQERTAEAVRELARTENDAAADRAEAAQRVADAVEEATERRAEAEKRLAEAVEDGEERQRDAVDRLLDAERKAVETRESGLERIAEAHKQANKRREDAERALADAHESAAERQAAAARRIQDAQRQLSEAHKQAAEERVAAERRVQDAHENLSDALRNQRRSHLDYNDLLHAQAEKLREIAEHTDGPLRAALLGFADQLDALAGRSPISVTLDASQPHAELAALKAEADALSFDLANLSSLAAPIPPPISPFSFGFFGESGGVMPLAQGSWLPLGGPGFSTNRPTYLVGEGGPYDEFVIPTDPKYRDRAWGLTTELLGRLGAGRTAGPAGGVASSRLEAKFDELIGLLGRILREPRRIEVSVPPGEPVAAGVGAAAAWAMKTAGR